MPLFYFDTRDGEDFVPDVVGLELHDVQAARAEAAAALAIMARDLVAGADARELAVEVSDEWHAPVLTASLRLEAAAMKR